METKLLDLWYCKSRKKEGDPIMVREWKDGKATVTHTDKWMKRLWDEDGNEIQLRIHFKNTYGKPKQQGATSMLEIIRID